MNCMQKLKKIIENDKLKPIMLFSTIWAVVAHGFPIFNKISYHDDIFNIVTSAGVESGRWGGFILDKILSICFGRYLSTPLFNGMIAIICIGFSVFIVSSLFDISDNVSLFLLTGISITFPTITSYFGYVFTIHAYCIGIFLCIAGAYMLCNNSSSIVNIVIAIFIISFGVGIYQAFIVLPFVVFEGWLFKVVCCEELSIKKFAKLLGGLCISSLTFFLVYYYIEMLFLRIYHTSLSSYQNISTMGKEGILTYLSRIPLTYKFFIWPSEEIGSDPFPLYTRYIYIIVIFLCVLYASVIVLGNRKNRNFLIESISLLITMPISVCFIYIMCDYTKTHIEVLQTYSYVGVFFFLVLLQKICKESFKYERLIKNISRVLFLMMIVLFVRYSNMCYTKAIIMQEQAKSYFTTLVSRIESVDGYSPECPVVFVNGTNKSIDQITVIKEFENVTISPFNCNTIINNFAWESFMNIWCGYKPVTIAIEQTGLDERVVGTMPSYPNDGSIKVLNGVVVVKF